MHPAYDIQPVWSIDGQHIAFASNRYGNFVVFLISKDGGTPKRLTVHSVDDMPCIYFPDNSSVLEEKPVLETDGTSCKRITRRTR
jgi:hypothetical protein